MKAPKVSGQKVLLTSVTGTFFVLVVIFIFWPWFEVRVSRGFYRCVDRSWVFVQFPFRGVPPGNVATVVLLCLLIVVMWGSFLRLSVRAKIPFLVSCLVEGGQVFSAIALISPKVFG